MKCGITNTTIIDGSDMYGFILVEKKDKNDNRHMSVDDKYMLFPIPIKGTYGDYGMLETVESQYEFLDKKMKMFDDDFTLKYNDKEYSLAKITELYDDLDYNCHYENQHQFHYLLGVLERQIELKIIPKIGMGTKHEYNMNMLYINGRFVDKLFDNYRVDPYMEDMSEKRKEAFRECAFDVFDRYSQLDELYLDKDEHEFDVYEFIRRYIYRTQTPIMPSSYGGQEVDYASLRLMSEFCEEEISYLHDMQYSEEEREFYKEKEELVKQDMGGTHWFSVKDGRGYKKY